MAVYQPFDYPQTLRQSALRGAVREQKRKSWAPDWKDSGKKGGWLPEERESTHLKEWEHKGHCDSETPPRNP